MKKILFAVAVGISIAANADVIYWMIDSNPVDVAQFSGSPISQTWDEARLIVDGSGVAGGTLTSSAWSEFDAIGAYAYTTLPNSYNSFAIELYQGGKFVGQTTGTAAQLAPYIFSSPMSVLPTTAFGMAAAGSTYAVPEPTSGLLFIIGGMLLGLKRKRQV